MFLHKLLHRLSLLIALTVGMLSTGKALAEPEYKIVAYYVSWDARRKPPFYPKEINGNLLTHLNYAFAKVDANGSISLLSPKDDIGSAQTDWKSIKKYEGNLLQLKNLKKKYSHLKTLISFGGWTLSDNFSALSASPKARKQFAQECVEFCKKFHFDGIDIDWEYPCLESHGGKPDDQKNFTLLLTDLYSAAKKQQPPLLVTIAGPATSTRYEKIDIGDVHKHVDWINLMCYNFHGPWGGKDDKVTNHHSALFPTKMGSASLNIDAAVKYYVSKGVPKKKLVIGMPLYGRSYAISSATSNGLYSNYSGAGKGTTVEGIRSFADIKLHLVNSYKRYWDDEAKAPYLYDPKTKHFVTYDDEKSLGIKCDYIKSQKLGGAMLWQLGWDTRPGWDALHVIYRSCQNKPD